MIPCRIFSGLEVELSGGGCCLVHSVLEELAVNSVLGVCCCHQMHLVIRDGSEEHFQGISECSSSHPRDSWVMAKWLQKFLQKYHGQCPPLCWPAQSGCGWNFPQALWSFWPCNVFFGLFFSPFHIHGNLCPKLGQPCSSCWQSGSVASLSLHSHPA